MESAAKGNVSSSIPKNYVTLKQLQELRLKEKHDEEERLRILNEELGRKAAESKPAKPYREPLGSKTNCPSFGPAPAPNPEVDGKKGIAGRANPKPPIGVTAGGDPNPQIGQKQKRKKKTTTTTTTKSKAETENHDGVEEAAAAKEEKEKEKSGSQKIAADPSSLEKPVQVKQGGGRDRLRRAEQRPRPRPTGLSGAGQERAAQMARPSLKGGDEAAAGPGRGRGGGSNQRPGGVGVGGGGGRSAGGAGPGQVWVRKTTDA